MCQLLQGDIEAIKREVALHGKQVVKEHLEYILNEPASEKEYPNGIRDRGRTGWRLVDFVKHPTSTEVGLKESHVVALRLYSTPAFVYLNKPLRDGCTSSRPHPLPICMTCIQEGIRKLQAIGAMKADAAERSILWRGMKDMRMNDTFMAKGGTEVACM